MRRCVAVTTGLPIIVNIILIFLFENGKLGRCDGIAIVGSSFIISIIMFLLALAGTGWMLFKREGEPLWVLLSIALIQTTCLAFVVLPFVRH